MNKIKIYQVDAFTGTMFKGNPAAVCPLENWLPDDILQSVAMENNLSETAFFIKKNDKFLIRWFTPKVEMNLCGHATLAAAHIIFSEIDLNKKSIELHTKNNEVLKINKKNNILYMNFPSYKPSEIKDKYEELQLSLGLLPSIFLAYNYGVAVFNNEKDVTSIEPDFTKLENLPYDGIIVTAPGNNVDFVSRFFAPKLGILEDPVTGSAHCELIPYWSNRLKKKNLVARQLSKRGGELYCSELKDRVLIGGRAITYLSGSLYI